jgi:hypothetical protein
MSNPSAEFSITNFAGQIMCCDCCHHQIAPGTERTLWDGVKHWVWVCATCFAFGSSVVFGQLSPPEAAPPIFIDVRAPSIYTNASAGTFTNTSTGMLTNASAKTTSGCFNSRVCHYGLPRWASPEQRKARHRLSKENFKLSAADQARLRSRS